jgi:hypothetical protein
MLRDYAKYLLLSNFLILFLACGSKGPVADLSERSDTVISADYVQGLALHGLMTTRIKRDFFGEVRGHYEFQLIDPRDGRQLVCVSTGDIDRENVEFWNIGNEVTLADAWPADLKLLQLLVIYKWVKGDLANDRACINDQSGDTYVHHNGNDELIGESHGITQEELIDQYISLTNETAFAVFSKHDAENPLQPNVIYSDEENPELVLDQMQFFGDFEISNPELEIHILNDEGAVLGCIEKNSIAEVDRPGWVHARLGAQFEPRLYLNDYAGQEVHLVISEVDGEQSCPDAPGFPDADLVFETDILFDDLFLGPVSFGEDNGFLQFVLQRD